MSKADCIEFTTGHKDCLNGLLKKKPTKDAPFCCRKLIAVVTAGKGLTDPAPYFPGCIFNKTCKSSSGKGGKRRITGPELQKLAAQGHDRALTWREKFYENNTDKEDPEKSANQEQNEDGESESGSHDSAEEMLFDANDFQMNSTCYFLDLSSTDESEDEEDEVIPPPQKKEDSSVSIKLAGNSGNSRPGVGNVGLPLPEAKEIELLIKNQARAIEQLQKVNAEQKEEAHRVRVEDKNMLNRLTQELNMSQENSLKANQLANGASRFSDTTLNVLKSNPLGDLSTLGMVEAGNSALNCTWVPDLVSTDGVFGLTIAGRTEGRMPAPKISGRSSTSLAKNSQNDWLRSKNRSYDWLELTRLLLKNTVAYDSTTFGSIFEYLEKEIKPFMKTEFQGLPLTTIAALIATRFPHSKQRCIQNIIDQVLDPFYEVEQKYTEIRKKQARFQRSNSTGDRMDYTSSLTEEQVANSLETKRVTEAVVYGDLFFELSHQLDPGTEIHFQTIEWQPEGLESLSGHFAALIFRDKLTSKKRDNVTITPKVTISCIWRCLEVLFRALEDLSTKMSSVLLTEIESEPRIKVFANRKTSVKGTEAELAALFDGLDEAHSTTKQRMIRFKQKRARQPLRHTKSGATNYRGPAVMMNQENTAGFKSEESSGEWSEDNAAVFAQHALEERADKSIPEANKRNHTNTGVKWADRGGTPNAGSKSSERDAGRNYGKPMGESRPKKKMEPRPHLINKKYDRTSASLMFAGNTSFEENRLEAISRWEAVSQNLVAFQRQVISNHDDQLLQGLMVNTMEADLQVEDNPHFLKISPASDNYIRTEEAPVTRVEDAAVALYENGSLYSTLTSLPKVPIISVTIKNDDAAKNGIQLNLDFRCLVDTGSSMNVIRFDVLQRMNLLDKKKRLEQPLLVQTCGNQIPLNSECHLEVKIGKLELGRQRFLIVPFEYLGSNGKMEGIIGTPALLQCGFGTFFKKWFQQMAGQAAEISRGGDLDINLTSEKTSQPITSEPKINTAYTGVTNLYPGIEGDTHGFDNSLTNKPNITSISTKSPTPGPSMLSPTDHKEKLERGTNVTSQRPQEPAQFGPSEIVYLPEVCAAQSQVPMAKPRMLIGIDPSAIIPSKEEDTNRRTLRRRPEPLTTAVDSGEDPDTISGEPLAPESNNPSAGTGSDQDVVEAPKPKPRKNRQESRPNRVDENKENTDLRSRITRHWPTEALIPCGDKQGTTKTDPVLQGITQTVSTETWSSYLKDIGENPVEEEQLNTGVFMATTEFDSNPVSCLELGYFDKTAPETRDLKLQWTETVNRGLTVHPDKQSAVRNARTSRTIAEVTGNGSKRPSRVAKKVQEVLEAAGGKPGVCPGTLMHVLETGLDSAQTFLPISDATPQEKETAQILALVHEISEDNRVNFLRAVCFMNNEKGEDWARQKIEGIREAIGGYRWSPNDVVLTEEQVDNRYPSGLVLEAQESVCIPKADVRDVLIAFPKNITTEGLTYITTETLIKEPGLEVPSRCISTAGGPKLNIMVLNNSSKDVYLTKGSKIVRAQAIRSISTSRLDSENYVKHTSPLTDIKLAEIMGVLEQVYAKKLFEHSDISTMEREAQEKYLELSREVANPLEMLEAKEGAGTPPSSATVKDGPPLGSRKAPMCRKVRDQTMEEAKAEVRDKIHQHILTMHPDQDMSLEQKYQILEQANPMVVGNNLVTSEQNVVINGLKAGVRRKLLAQLDNFEQNRIEEFLNCIRALPDDMAKLLVNYAHRFYGDRNFEWEMIRCDKDIIQIPLRETIPMTLSPNYIKKLASDELECINDFICSNLARGLLRKSRSNYINPILLVKKPNNRGYRICLDFRKANDEVFDSSSHQVPLIQDMILLMGNAELFSCFDVSNAYYRVELPEKYRKFCAFQVPKGPYTGLWEFCVLPFGVKPAVSIFSQVMDQALRGLQYKNVLWYLDDVLVYTELPHKYQHLKGEARKIKLLQIHKEQIELFLMRSTTYNLTYSIEKVAFLKENIEFLGFVIGSGIIVPSPKTIAKLEAICEIGQVERPLKSWQRILGFFNYTSANIPGFATQRKLIMKLHTKYHEFCAESKSVIKRERLRAIAQPCIDGFLKYWCECVEKGQLAIPPPNVPLRLYTDASVLSIGFVLTTLDHRVIWFSSRVLSEAEQNYQIEELEVLALYEGMVKTKVYSVRASEMNCMLDNKNHIRSMISYKTPPISDRTAKFLAKLRNYGELNVKYVATDRQMADLLTRDVGDLDKAGFDAVQEVCRTTDPISERNKEERKILKAETKASKVQEGIFEEDELLKSERLKEESGIFTVQNVLDWQRGEQFQHKVSECLYQMTEANEATALGPRKEEQRTLSGFESIFWTQPGQGNSSQGIKPTLARHDEHEHERLVLLTQDEGDRDWVDRIWDPISVELNRAHGGEELGWMSEAQGRNSMIMATMEPLEANSKWARLPFQHFTKDQLVEIKSQPHRSTEEEQAQLAWWVHAIHYCRIRGKELLQKLLLWFPGVAFTEKGIAEVVRNCQKCQMKRRLAPSNSIGNIRVPEAPFEMLSIDHFQYLSYTEGQYRYLLTVKDDFSKFVNLIPVRTKTMREVWVVLDTLFVMMGKPKVIRADNAFRTREFLEWGATRNICSYFSPPYRPRANGMVERVHVEINDLMPKILEVMNKEPKDWLWGIPLVAKCINHTPSSTHGFAPELVTKGFLSDERFIYTFTGKLDLMTIWEKVQQRLKDKKKNYAKAHKVQPIDVLRRGDLCLMKSPGRDVETIEVLIDLGSTVLANRTGSHPVDRNRTLVFHKEFLHHKVIESEEKRLGESLTFSENYMGFIQKTVGH